MTVKRAYCYKDSGANIRYSLLYKRDEIKSNLLPILKFIFIELTMDSVSH